MWNESLSVNVAEIDLQHKKLIDMINELNNGMKVGKGQEVLGKIVGELVSYSVTHFQTEERYFDQFGYPETDAHKKEHAAFSEKAMEIKNKFETRSLMLSIEVMDFLSDWLKKHIMGSDKKYAAFFNANGLK
jgi:hemerythrin